MKKLIIALTACILLTGCSEDGAKSAVEAYGFSSVTLGGTPFFGCSKDDSYFYSFKFTAMNAQGKPISGVVCGGPLKGYTVRIM